MSLSNLPLKRLGEVLQLQQRAIRPKSGTSYRLAGVRLYGKGCRIQDGTENDAHKAPTLSQIRAGDIIYNKMWASKGAFALVRERFDGCWVTSEYPIFSAKDGCSAEYLRYVFEQPWFWGLAKAWSSGTTSRARLQPRDFLRIPAPIPGSEQERVIVEVLGSQDETMAEARRLLKQLAAAKFWTMRELLTHGHPVFAGRLRPFRESWPMGRIAPKIDKVPAHWALVRLTDVARLESGHTPSRSRPDYWNGGIPWISLQDTEALEELEISQTRETVSELGIQNSSARILLKGTVVFLRTASVGLCSIMGRDMATSQHFANWVCGPKVDPHYLVQVFRHMTREWRRLQAGSVLPDVYMPVFENLQILLPPREEQAAIAAGGESFDRRIAAERAYLDQLQETKRGLAQALLSGRKLVPPQALRREEA
jgi:type I restriction enzyme, S subunit